MSARRRSSALPFREGGSGRHLAARSRRAGEELTDLVAGREPAAAVGSFAAPDALIHLLDASRPP